MQSSTKNRIGALAIATDAAMRTRMQFEMMSSAVQYEDIAAPFDIRPIPPMQMLGKRGNLDMGAGNAKSHAGR
jgi:hypothetical protein